VFTLLSLPLLPLLLVAPTVATVATAQGALRVGLMVGLRAGLPILLTAWLRLGLTKVEVLRLDVQAAACWCVP
jgi:hypothetical protein